MRVTIKDIAREAHIDTGAVSRTLRNDPLAQRLRPETRQRILDAAKRLGYKRNLLASYTRLGKVDSIAVIGAFSENESTFNHAGMLNGLLNECASEGYSIHFFSDQLLDKAFEEITGTLIRHVICFSLNNEKREKTAVYCRENQLKLIYIYEHSHGEFPTVNVDNYEAGRLAVQYLNSRGHHRIGLLGAPEGRFHYIDERCRGYLAGMHEAGLQPDSVLVSRTDDTEKAVAAMLALDEAHRPTAMFGISDTQAAIALRYACQHGISVPEELSFLGMGNTGSICDLAAVPLSSIDPSTRLYGTIAVRLLLESPCSCSPDEHNNFLISPRIISRNSVS